MLRVVPGKPLIIHAPWFSLEEQRNGAGIMTGCKRDGRTIIGFI
jgi:hypothetical protein